MSALTDNEFIVRVVVPRLHEEVAQLRRDLSACEEALSEIVEGAETLEQAEALASHALARRDVDMTPADYTPGWGFNKNPEPDVFERDNAGTDADPWSVRE